jgi:hypothetical protein
MIDKLKTAGAVIVGAAAAFVYTAGWLSPHRLRWLQP